MRTLNHRQLLGFRAVMVTGSMTGAGKILHLSQPAVTRLIKDLERELDLPLFIRTGVAVKPTQQALELFREVERYFNGVDRIVETAGYLRNRRGGRLRIAAMSTLSSRSLPEAIHRFKQIEPELDFYVHSDTSHHILDAVQRNEFDIGFGRVPAERTDIEHLPMPTSSAICLVPRHHRLAAKESISVTDLHREQLISLGTSSLLRLQIEAALESAGVRGGTVIQTLFSNTVPSYVARGLGIGVTDIFSVLGADRTNIVVRRFAPELAFDFSAIFPRSEHSPLAIAFARTMLNVVANDIAEVEVALQSVRS
ncbi:LysR family transcriptional regulator [Sinorhizobium meliloti]|uniref:LysR family transcriptional regulator n=1 Tax=Rhizobium meliloti TaxID=382 RepID=UPI000FDB4C86|nr:LysR family transcriptional regulator [Sinorhizobium meliloti]MDW9724774.1 LysR family transcriptional regulator [Sinorhizobium meliloti]MDW9730857.1 LysR family transcriptional regulator [Sinorhizobium meliloti]MDW9787450.1 LysR family transcriptional regulator [Sinorhizobium meliloti]RVG24489.1 LysR family transcriptional regulator [Sinorhizobium meliloti]